MSTRYVYQTTITVTVHMADPGEQGADYDVTPCATKAEQEESAREWAEQAMPMEDYAEDWVKVDAPALVLVSSGPVEPLRPGRDPHAPTWPLPETK